MANKELVSVAKEEEVTEETKPAEETTETPADTTTGDKTVATGAIA